MVKITRLPHKVQKVSIMMEVAYKDNKDVLADQDKVEEVFLAR
jgi:hypothetical protein